MTLEICQSETFWKTVSVSPRNLVESVEFLVISRDTVVCIKSGLSPKIAAHTSPDFKQTTVSLEITRNSTLSAKFLGETETVFQNVSDGHISRVTQVAVS